MLWDQAPKISVFRDNTVAFIDDLPADAISNAPGDSDYGRAQLPASGAQLRAAWAAGCAGNGSNCRVVRSE